MSMKTPRLKIVIFGLSITSSWGNGHATTYRSLVRALVARGHQVLFLERDVPWYAAARDLPKPPYGRTVLYRSLSALQRRFAAAVRRADLVIVGSYVPDAIAIGEWVVSHARGITAFYDIDTPITMEMIRRGGAPYLSIDLIARYRLYLSFTGGPLLKTLERRYHAPRVRPLYCSVDPRLYYPEQHVERWDLGYMGTYSRDRQPILDRLLIEPARRCRQARMVVAGPKYPRSIRWPANIDRIEHLAPRAHRKFYNCQALTLNVTRKCMVRAGYSPSVRLFESAACGRPIVSDYWPGLEDFFKPGEEILVANKAEDILRYMRRIPAAERRRIGGAARRRVLAAHTAAHRAEELENYLMEIGG
jgi:spore maturation protein CgeB